MDIETKLTQVWPAFLEWYHREHHIMKGGVTPDFTSVMMWLEFQESLWLKFQESLRRKK